MFGNILVYVLAEPLLTVYSHEWTTKDHTAWLFTQQSQNEFEKNRKPNYSSGAFMPAILPFLPTRFAIDTGQCVKLMQNSDDWTELRGFVVLTKHGSTISIH